MDNHAMVSASLAAVIRQSLNPDFRKECYLLLGVTHNRDAQEVIYSRLKLRGPNATEKKIKNPIQVQNDDGANKSNAGCHKPVPDQSVNIDSKLPNMEQESCDVSTLTQVLGSHHDPSMIQANKMESIDSVESALTDDESQLDWDTEVSK
ncbi:uncharacterized protein LOC117641267 [Thrips palmi]|uniref:Uncharacterized protein LOC117641267 n=1 Tax=Thrips palmi TaxID=161013 RepID=A0A6P8YC40_THRPL|nr:uncharacterized protein LOC117641267 [Thrips palmi]